MNNQVIKVLSSAHGKKIIQFWKDRGVYTDRYTGDISEHSGNLKIYYGVINCVFGNYTIKEVNAYNVAVIELPEYFELPRKWVIRAIPSILDLVLKFFNDGCNDGCKYTHKHKYSEDAINNYFHFPCFSGSANFNFGEHSTSAKRSDYTEITPEQFIKYVLKETTTPKIMTERKLKIQNYRRIHNAACPNWKTKLQDMYAKKFAISDEVIIPEDDYRQMRIACTKEQNILFDEIFGTDEEIYPDGTPCLVTGFSCEGWSFRYANGAGRFYDNGKKSGPTSSWAYCQKLDINNLPVNS